MDCPDPLLPYFAGYPPDLLAGAASMLRQGTLLDTLSRRHGPPHDLRTDGALYGYGIQIKSRYLRNADPLSRVTYDNRLHAVRNALGMHTAVSRLQGGRLQAKRALRAARLFTDGPVPLLRLVVRYDPPPPKEWTTHQAIYALILQT